MDGSISLPSGSTSPSGCPHLDVGSKEGSMHLRPKDSIAMVGVRDHASLKIPEGYDMT